MNENPLISVITVCKNSSKTIERTLKSVEKQSYAPIEYIVIDCVSNDGTLEIVKSCSAVTKWVSEMDEGIADAFNKGIALANGEWIGILNADDWYESDTVAAVMAHAGSYDVIHGSVRYWRRDGGVEIVMPNHAVLHREMSINHPSVFVRRSVYEHVGYFDLSYRYAMDYELLLRISKSGYRFFSMQGVVLANMCSGGQSCVHWIRALCEASRAKEHHYPSLYTHKAYLVFQIFRSYVRFFLEKMGCHGIVRFYRQYFSLMKKII